MIPRRLQIALIVAFLCHGLFILTARYRLSYDAYTHMLFANHYAEDWFSLWETRWYTGFTVVSYPPLVHQLIALFIPVLGFDAAYAFVLWIVTSLYPFGIYTFSRIFAGKSTSSYAALASAILLPIYVTAHIFGQLPFLTSTLFALFGAASLNRYLREGGILNLALTVSLASTTMAMHHATLLLQPFLVFAVLTGLFFDHRVVKLVGRIGNATPGNRDLVVFESNDPHGENQKKEFSGFVSPWLILSRLLLYGFLVLFCGFLVIWPFWQWGTHQTMQIPIDHLSRHNFLTDPLASLIFFWPLYGPLIVIIPFLFRRWSLRLLGLITSFTILFLLGFGGTTSLPRLFFGDKWEWLTYDRFAFWASLTLTPFFGMIFIPLKRSWSRQVRAGWMPVSLRRKIFSAITFSVFTLTALGAWLTPILFPIQPKAIDMQPIVDFLNKDDRSSWRYLTFGFGDQFAYLNLRTKATTLDGSYHTARTLPELRESGIGQVDTVYWASKGVSAIIPILEDSDLHGVRWGFVNPVTLQAISIRWGVIHRNPFIPVLEELGWIKIKTLKNGIQVYENPDAIFPELSEPPLTSPITAFSWGFLPVLSFVTTLSLGALRIWHLQAEQALRNVYTFIVALVPLSLCFWYYRTVAEIHHDRVYFIYTSALFFLSDGLVLLAVILWVSRQIAQPGGLQIHAGPVRHKLLSLLSDFRFSLFALLLLSSVSIFWSSDWRTSLYVSLHFWLIFLLILSLRDWGAAWKPIILGLCAALSIQMITAFAGFAIQSTTFLESLDLKWPGLLDPSTAGSSVVAVPDGPRILRAYGTMPHPNILGGFALILLLGPASLFLVNRRTNYAALIMFSLGSMVVALTFSRSAWLGLMVFISLLIVKSRYLNRKRLFVLTATTLITVALTLSPTRDLVYARISNSPVETEQVSTTGRVWLNQQAVNMIRQYPFTGVGVGSFIIQLASYAREGSSIEPEHNILLLAGAELGVIGGTLVSILFVSVISEIIKARSPKSILASALLAGMGTVSLFDHYLWSLAPGRLMLGLALGLWAGSVNDDRI
jgi:O-antigen ligase